ncbi:MAG: Spy/CpxP family protein refolding chaperone [Stellaceae bacterium]
MLATPFSAARAEQTVAAQTPAAAAATETKGETVEQRITSLHAALKITPAQDAKWNAVAQAMRENASTMDKLIASNRTTAPQSKTAVEDLKTYQEFAQAHVDGLKNLIGSFSTLYAAMPDAQKKVADEVFTARQAARSKS